VGKEFQQVQWDGKLEDDCRQLVRLAIREDQDRSLDETTLALVPADCQGSAAVVSRQRGVIAGLQAAEIVLDEMEIDADWKAMVRDGTTVGTGTEVALFTGVARDLLTAERLLLNLIGQLSGIATLASKFVHQVAHTKARVYDTRKTTPGWRRLEKYAVRCGGAHNHRTGLFDAVLIKDNHLALLAEAEGTRKMNPGEAVAYARQRIRELRPSEAEAMIVEVEVDSLEQLDQVLPEQPDIVLLDNMTNDQLREAVARRDRTGFDVELEASGGVNLETIAGIAETGVERISVGAITHSAVALDVGLDWRQR
jgi:nicotinate-nucleotide pyrophosphorylase (carboxylating)